jgi:hypothetical protein
MPYCEDCGELFCAFFSMPVALVSRIIYAPLAEYLLKGFERFSEILLRKMKIC